MLRWICVFSCCVYCVLCWVLDCYYIYDSWGEERRGEESHTVLVLITTGQYDGFSPFFADLIYVAWHEIIHIWPLSMIMHQLIALNQNPKRPLGVSCHCLQTHSAAGFSFAFTQKYMLSFAIVLVHIVTSGPTSSFTAWHCTIKPPKSIYAYHAI